MSIIKAIGAFSRAQEYFDQLKKDNWQGNPRANTAGTVGSRIDYETGNQKHGRAMRTLGGIALLSRFRPTNMPKVLDIARNRFAPIVQSTTLGKVAEVGIEAAKLTANVAGINIGMPSYADTKKYAFSDHPKLSLKARYGLTYKDYSPTQAGGESPYGFFDKAGKFHNGDYEDLVNVDISTDGDAPIKVRGIIAAFSDTITPTWNETAYVGRPDPMLSYAGFAREVAFDLTLAAINRTSLRPMYVQLNKIADLVLPKRDQGGAIGARYSGNLCNLTVGNYVVNELAACTGVTITPSEECPWELLDPDKDYPQTGAGENASLSSGLILDTANGTVKNLVKSLGPAGAAATKSHPFKVPRVVTINLGFKILHNEIPGAGNRPLIRTNTQYDNSRITGESGE